MLRLTIAKLATCSVAIFFAISPAVHAQNITAKHLQIYHAPDGDRWHMTVNQEERDQIKNYRKEWENYGWSVFAFDAPASGTVSLYRYTNPKSGDHFFTINQEEGMNAVKFFGYADEGVCCYVSPSSFTGGTPIFRLLKGGQHRYVFQASAKDNLTLKEGWKLEGIEGYAWLPLTCPEPSLPAQ